MTRRAEPLGNNAIMEFESSKGWRNVKYCKEAEIKWYRSLTFCLSVCETGLDRLD